VTVERRLRDFTAPGEAEARERARAVSAAAFAARTPRRRPSRLRMLPAVAAAGLIVALAATAPGEAVADWFRDLVRADRPTPGRAPALTALPAPGRLLVTGPGGAWVVQADGSSRRLGAFEDASWSPRGLFVAVTRGRSLSAVEPDGSVRWTLARAEPVSQPEWAPSGFRIAYRAGRALRVVAGDVSADRLLTRSAAAVAPAWKPDRKRHMLAFAGRRGAVELRDTDKDRIIWRSKAGPTPVDLEWVAGGRSLAVLRGDRLELLDGAGRIRRTERLPGRAVSSSARPGRTDLAVSVDGRDGTGRVMLLRVRGTPPAPRTLFASPGAIREVVFSHDGTTILASRLDAGEWLFLPVERGRARATGGIARHFDPRRARPRGMPTVRGWTR
jgi:hypothetical protein